MNANREITHTVSEALKSDLQLCRLLSRDHIFEEKTADDGLPCISICESGVEDPCLGKVSDQEAIVTLQIWPRSGEKELADTFMISAQHALEAAGLVNGKSGIALQPVFSGTRRLSGSREIHGILRYHAFHSRQAA